MNKKDALTHFGSTTNLAEALGVSTQAISQWGDKLPQGRAYQIESITNGQLKVDEKLYQKKISKSQAK